jgi:CubicO group peptidase (beta-lactamase class C family)
MTTHSRQLGLGCVALFCLLVQAIGGALPLAAQSSEGSVEHAAVAVEGRLDDMRVAEAAYAVISGDEQLVAGYGAASSDTPFVIASVSKSFTALAILQLVDRGLVGLDSPVNDYIDWFTTADTTGSITVRQLLNQTSGLSTLDGVRDVITPEASLEERVRSIADYSLISEPGAEFHYSNLNYAVLGLLIEKVSGMGYGEFVQKEIFDPLDMDHSYFDFELALANGLALGTISVFGLPISVTQTAYPGLVPDGYLISTAADLANYARFQMGDGSFNGRMLLSGESMDMMHRPAVTSQGGPYLDHYAMGWRTGSISDQKLIGHDGNTFGYHADVAVLPDLDAAVVVLSAHSGISVTRLDVPAVEALTGGTPQASRPSTTAWVVLDAIAALVVISVTISALRRRRRRHMNPPRIPKRWPAILQIVAGVLIGAAVGLLASSLAGGLDVVTFRIFWGLAPDVLVVAVAIPLLLIAAGIATFWQRRAAQRMSSPDAEPTRSVQHV